MGVNGWWNWPGLVGFIYDTKETESTLSLIPNKYNIYIYINCKKMTDSVK